MRERGKERGGKVGGVLKVGTERGRCVGVREGRVKGRGKGPGFQGV